MTDPGQNAADKAVDRIEKRIVTIYKQAAREVKRKYNEFAERFREEDRAMRQKKKQKLITEEEYAEWRRGRVFIGEQWQNKMKSIADTLTNANVTANAVVNGERQAVFGENVNYQQYLFERDTGMAVSFNLYDSATVTRLIRERPELLPRRQIKGIKDRAWNKVGIANVITQGIIQGESIPDIANRLADETGERNMKAMMRYARTAMTSAQNAGRIEAMHNAQDLGITVKKKWIATLDSRTRDTHAALDGDTAEVDEDFSNGLKYPGDPGGVPGEVYNCRCTLGYVYPEYPFSGDRGMYNEYKDKDGNYHREYMTISDLTYKQWKQSKEAGNLAEVSAAKKKLNNLQRMYVVNDMGHVFKGIWRNQDVTYADWDKYKDRIQGKRDYYESMLKQYEASGDSAMADQMRAMLKELDLFEQNGALYSRVIKDREAALKDFQDLLPKPPVTSPFGPEAYTQERRDGAVWDVPKVVDKFLRDRTGEVWRNATPEERDAVFEYTQSYHKYNEPLRGIEYGSNDYKGVGNTDLNASYANNGPRLNAMTDIIDKCTYDQDVWLQRGVGYGGMDKFFGVDQSLLMHGSQAELERALLGQTVTEYGFMSCGTARGQGFSRNPIIFNIYAPSGTKMMYVEPFSAFGGGDGKRWDGKSTQAFFGSEFETILQQGTQFRIAKIERKGNGTIYMDLWVINQDTQQRWNP